MQLTSQALVFPGQGSQMIGMGKNLYDNFAVARDVFERIDEALHFKLTDMMFNGSADELNLTCNAQPAIMATSAAYWEVFKNTGLIDMSRIKFMAGHSLGEYSALYAAGALSLEETAQLLKARGEYMMQACNEVKGAMAAVLGLDFAAVKMLADLNDCYVANSNSPAQIVISGEEKAVKNAADKALLQGAKRTIFLNVSGAFHSPLMLSAADKMADILKNAKVSPPEIKVISNVTAREYFDANDIKSLLVEQITNTVKWQESISYIIENNVMEFIEVGFGNILSGLIKKIVPETKVKTSDELIQQLIGEK